MIAVHKVEVHSTALTDERLVLQVEDLMNVEQSALQGMPLIGAWFEARILDVVRQNIPGNLKATGAVQIYDPMRPLLRSRSWDVAVFDPVRLPEGLPPAPTPQDGPPLLPSDSCLLVIDTKTVQCDVRKYCEKSACDKSGPHDHSSIKQLDLIGPSVKKLLVFGKVTGSPLTLHQTASAFGVEVLCLSKMKIFGKIEDGFDLRTTVVSPLKVEPPCLDWAGFLNMLQEL